MKTSDLIQQLASELKPVKPVRFSLLDLCKVIGAGLFCVFSAVAILGIRVDFGEQASSALFIFDGLWLLVLGVLSAGSAFVLSIPSPQARSAYTLPLMAFVLILLSTAYSFLTYSDPLLYLGHGFFCGFEIIAIGALPAAVLFYLVRRAAALRRDIVGVLALVCGASFGLLGAQLTCADSTPLHMLFWHILPAVLIAASGIWIAKKVLPEI